jgi:hypothetical protein
MGRFAPGEVSQISQIPQIEVASSPIGFKGLIQIPMTVIL